MSLVTAILFPSTASRYTRSLLVTIVCARYSTSRSMHRGCSGTPVSPELFNKHLHAQVADDRLISTGITLPAAWNYANHGTNAGHSTPNHTSASHSDVRDDFPMSNYAGPCQGQFQYMQVSMSEKLPLAAYPFCKINVGERRTL
jgi:hypothetical protein